MLSFLDESKVKMIKSVKEQDINAIRNLNQCFLPAVSSVTEAGFKKMTAKAAYFYQYKIEKELAGFLLAFAPNTEYKSLNYQWFQGMYESDFIYVDRIVIKQAFQKQGIGKILYQDLEKKTEFSKICCEVNIKPLNQNSLNFHHRLGFVEVGQQDTDNSTKRVSLLCKKI